MTDLYADSTIGMTAYNIVAMHRQSLGLGAIHTLALGLQHAHLEQKQLEKALAKLVKLGCLRRNEGDKDLFELVARDRLMVVQRDLGDYDSRTMKGGWEGWQCKDPRIQDGIGVRPLEAVIGLPATGRVPRPLNMEARS